MPKKILPHPPVTTANALTATAVVLYVLCVVWVKISRPTYMSMMGGWFHGVNWQALPAAPMMGGNLLSGLVTFAIVAWVSGYLFASFYNWFASRE